MGQRHAPTALYPRERPGTNCRGSWASPVQPVASRYIDYANRLTFGATESLRGGKLGGKINILNEKKIDFLLSTNFK